MDISQYRTISQYLSKYPADASILYAGKDLDCAISQAPTLGELQSHFGKTDDGAREWMVTILQYMATCSGCRMDAKQESVASQIILSAARNIKPSQVLLFVYKFNQGEYERLIKFDVQVLVRSIKAFSYEQNAVLERYKTEQELNEKKERMQNLGNSRALYRDYLVKAIYGDKAAMSALRLTSREQIATCTAVCVRLGEFPRSVLDRFSEDERERMERIINAKGPLFDR